MPVTPRRLAALALAALLLAPGARAAARPDFDADGRADVLWRDATGQLRLWLMDTTPVATGQLPPPADPQWRLEGLGDLDGDGRADLLFRHAQSGENELWSMNGTTRVRRLPLRRVIDPDWRVAAVHDFDGDGRDDVLWRHEALGAHVLWRMGPEGGFTPRQLTSEPELRWRVLGAGDLDGDGRADLLWRQGATSATRACLVTDGAHACSALPTVPAVDWQLAAVADFGGDGKADLLWRSDSAQATRLWTMNGATLASVAPVDLPAKAELLAVGDFDGDGKADLLWRGEDPLGRTSGTYVWLMDGPLVRARLRVGDTQGPWNAFAPPAPPPTPPNPPGTGAPGVAEARRFLDQCGLGATPAQVARVQSLGYAGFLDEQLALPASGYYDFVAAASTTNDGARLGALRTRFFMNAQLGEDQLRQRVVLALSQIVVVSVNGVYDGPGMAVYLDLLGRHAFGNYRQLLQELTLNPGMGDYLDMVNNDKPNPATGRQANENYARELLQLFTIGLVELHPTGAPRLDAAGRPIPTYDQDVVEGLARAFTGWTYAPAPGQPPQPHNPRNYLQPMVLWPANHDSGEKLILRGQVLPAGQTGQQDLDQALDAIFAHPNLGVFVGRQLIQHLVTSSPSPGYVARVAAAFDGLGTGVRGDLRATLRAVLLDPEARRDPAGQPDFGRLKEPLLFMTGLVRHLGGAGQGYGLTSYTANMAQDVWSPPTVFGFYSPDYRLPGTGVNAPPFQIYAESTAVRRANFVNTLVFGTIGLPSYAPPGATSVAIDFTPWTSLAGDPAALVADLDQRLMHGRMSSAMRDTIVAAVSATSSTSPSTRARTALYLVATSPQYQVQR